MLFQWLQLELDQSLGTLKTKRENNRITKKNLFLHEFP